MSLIQVYSTLEAGGSASLSAGGDIGLLASRVEAGEGLGLVANDEDYFRYEKNESGGLFGGDKHRLDEVQDLRAQGCQTASNR